MFATIGHTFALMKMSWRVLMKDRELIAFPLFAGAGVLVVSALFLAVGSGAGTLDRMQTMRQAGGTGTMTTIDAVLGVGLYVLAYFIVIFFNTALVSAALERLRGGDPTIGSGLRAASARLPAIIGWAIIAATVGLILQALRNRTDNALGRIAIGLVGGVWAYMTFFVVPLLVSEGLGPIAAIRRSSELLRRTWGRQVAASFGFGLVYIVAILIAFLPAALIFTVEPLAGIVLGVFTMAIAMAVVAALEGIFKAALYEFANGESPLEFDHTTLQAAYRSL